MCLTSKFELFWDLTISHFGSRSPAEWVLMNALVGTIPDMYLSTFVLLMFCCYVWEYMYSYEAPGWAHGCCGRWVLDGIRTPSSAGLLEVHTAVILVCNCLCHTAFEEE